MKSNLQRRVRRAWLRYKVEKAKKLERKKAEDEAKKQANKFKPRKTTVKNSSVKAPPALQTMKTQKLDETLNHSAPNKVSSSP